MTNSDELAVWRVDCDELVMWQVDWQLFETQEHAWGPLSPCQVWWGSDLTAAC